MAKRIIVAGGGASGMCAAIYAARNGAQVTVIEKNTVTGKKLSMTGNGRCNLTNLDMRPDCYNPAAVKRMEEWLSVYGVEDAIRFFRSLGVVVKNENGYVYPLSGQAQTVVDAFNAEMNRLGVKVVYGQQVKKIEGSGTYIVSTNQESFEADAVIIATGALSGAKSTMSSGDGYYICKKLGMTVKDTIPALVGFKAAEGEVMPSAGVRVDANISFYIGAELIASEYGEVQLTAEGISGIPVMQASGLVGRHIARKRPVVAELDLFPDYDENDFASLKSDMLSLRDNRTVREFLRGLGNSHINEMIIERMKLGPDMKMKNVSPSMTECILDNYRALKIRLGESYGYQASQVTAGGISLGDIKSDFSSVADPNIFCIGELLDVDGRCGGYNLQFAWISGSIAGCASSL